MLTPEQHEFRKTGIGGSDAAAIAGHSQYKTVVDVYLNKMGIKTEKKMRDDSDPDALKSDPRYWGHVLEPVVAAQYEFFEGRKVYVEPDAIRHPKYTWMIANLDRRIVGENGILECKSSHEYNLRKWGEEYSDDFPDEYLFQCMHYAIVANPDYVDCAVIIGGNKYRCYRYERNVKAENHLIEIEHDFWHNNILKGIPPEPKYYEDACKLWRKAINKEKTLPVDLIDHYKSYLYTNNKINELKEQLDFDKAKLCGFLQEANVLLNPLGAKIATWNEQATNRLDMERFKEEQPDIYKQYLYTQNTRVLRVKEIKA